MVIRVAVAVALPLVVLVAAAGFLVRWTVADPKLRARIVHYVAASSGMATEVSGPIRVRMLPRPTVELESVSMRGADGAVTLDADSMLGTLGLGSLLTGKLQVTKTVLTDPTMAVDIDRLAPLLGALAHPIASAALAGVGAAPLRFLHTGGVTFRSGVLRLQSQDPRQDTLVTDIWATLAWPEGDGASLSGSARWHGVRGSMTALLDTPDALLGGRISATYVRLKSPVLDLTMDGAVSRIGDNLVTGRITASTPDLPSFLRAVGTPSPELQGIRNAKLSGDATVSGGTLALSNLRLSLDDMLFDGAMAFNDHAGHPGLAGTLATENIDLAPFLVALPSPLAQDGGWSRVPFDTGSVAYDDIDLRISASQATLGRLRFEDAGLSLQSGGGRMELSLGEARAYEGLFKGRIVAKIDGNETEVRADATVSQFDLKALADDFDGVRQLTGTTTGHVTLEGSGKTTAALIASLDGRGQITVRDGDIGPTLASRLVHSEATGAIPAISLDQVDFDSASLGFEVARGAARVVDGWILRSTFRALVEGSSSLPGQTVDLIAQVLPAGDDAQSAAIEPSTMVLTGTWRDLKLSRKPPHPFSSGPPAKLAEP